MKRLLTLFCLISCLLTASADLKKYNLEVGDFSELTVASDIKVIYKHLPDSAGHALYICHPSVAPAITFINNKRKLKIEVSSDDTLRYAVPTITIYSNDLTKVTNLGDSLVDVQSVNKTDQFSAKVIGNGAISVRDVECARLSAAVEAGHGEVTLSGTAQEAKYTIASVGTVCAFGVDCAHAKCWVIGSGTIECSPSEALTLYGAGSGWVLYHGNPAIKKRAVGVKLERVEK